MASMSSLFVPHGLPSKFDVEQSSLFPFFRRPSAAGSASSTYAASQECSEASSVISEGECWHMTAEEDSGECQKPQPQEPSLGSQAWQQHAFNWADEMDSVDPNCELMFTEHSAESERCHQGAQEGHQGAQEGHAVSPRESPYPDSHQGLLGSGAQYHHGQPACFNEGVLPLPESHGAVPNPTAFLPSCMTEFPNSALLPSPEELDDFLVELLCSREFNPKGGSVAMERVLDKVSKQWPEMFARELAGQKLAALADIISARRHLFAIFWDGNFKRRMHFLGHEFWYIADAERRAERAQEGNLFDNRLVAFLQQQPGWHATPNEFMDHYELVFGEQLKRGDVVRMVKRSSLFHFHSGTHTIYLR